MTKINMDSIPLDLLKYEIKPYLFCFCSKCNNDVVADDTTTKIYMKKYKSIFDDDFYVYYDDVEYFKILCNNCYVYMLNQNMFPIKKDT